MALVILFGPFCLGARAQAVFRSAGPLSHAALQPINRRISGVCNYQVERQEISCAMV